MGGWQSVEDSDLGRHLAPPVGFPSEDWPSGGRQDPSLVFRRRLSLRKAAAVPATAKEDVLPF